ncbi:hypothetical protein GLOTRDRAFT_76396 [Gloeophyllum trabeum ATCC 11539]|uniref:Orc1-like AAA ATPase domain-containing protein n=1 Tax=Gloeophyllum trabeum (strain ATCC 11539 / FP-39264 / Madison 617) TaxID=670483 RepID=S7RQB9_GLOTA|nr:uncharacterized protein GLOTRDRAFT_76396 [Gloeophyllum trabeum ATCC 11539]EPQ55089.1 hypothetical protein GLOTRDRAFT_76396 [Gloeophyllum trabeum ATCC 11539]
MLSVARISPLVRHIQRAEFTTKSLRSELTAALRNDNYRSPSYARFASTTGRRAPRRPRLRITRDPETSEKHVEADAGVFQPINIGPQLPSFSSSGLRDAAITTMVGLMIVFVGGVAYVSWYKKNVLDKIEKAFSAGYDPALELANHGKRSAERPIPYDEFEVDNDVPWTEHMRRKEQDLIDRVIKGRETGHYFVLLGPKGVGKTTMIFDAIQTIQADGVAFCDAHPDLEVFRLRLGKALNFEFYEDSQTGLFQRRDPREGGPALDIERAMNKVEKVALRCSEKRRKPLVLVFNNIHFFHNDEEGRNMLLLLQQHAESWAASGILTVVFTSDDFWPYQVLRKSGSRMQVLSIYDLDQREALRASTKMRMDAKQPSPGEKVVREALGIIGGRLSYLNKVSRARDMLGAANHLKDVEKAWLLSQIGLIPDCDDDVMDEQKWSSCTWLLLREFVKLRREQERERAEKLAAGEQVGDNIPLPSIPYWKCREIMTRADFMEDLDRANIIAIDVHHDVRPDSELILHAACDVVEQEGFDELLDDVRDRIDEIEGLHRTRELTFKDLDKGDRIKLSVDKSGTSIVES